MIQLFQELIDQDFTKFMGEACGSYEPGCCYEEEYDNDYSEGDY